MANFLSKLALGLGHAAGVAGQALEGYGIEKQQRIKQAMADAEAKRAEARDELAKRETERRMQNDSLKNLMDVRREGYRTVPEFQAAQKTSATPIATGGFGMLPYDLPSMVRRGPTAPEPLTVPGYEQEMVQDRAATPDALADKRSATEWDRTQTARKAERAQDVLDKQRETDAANTFTAGQNRLDRESNERNAGTRAGGGALLPNSAIENLSKIDDVIGLASTSLEALNTAVANGKDATGRVGGVLKVPAWMRDTWGQGGAQGKTSRALLGNLFSTVALMRSGAAISAAEFEYLSTFMPDHNVDEADNQLKLKLLIKGLETVRANRLRNYSDYGKGSGGRNNAMRSGRGDGGGGGGYDDFELYPPAPGEGR